MNDQTLGETILEVVTMIILTIVVALMVMAGLRVSFASAEAPGKHATPTASEVLTKQSPSDVKAAPAKHHQHDDDGAGH